MEWLLSEGLILSLLAGLVHCCMRFAHAFEITMHSNTLSVHRMRTLGHCIGCDTGDGKQTKNKMLCTHTINKMDDLQITQTDSQEEERE